MPNTLSIDTKTLNIWDFPKKLHSLSILSAEYSENSGSSVQFFQKIGKIHFYMQNINKSNTFIREKF